MSDATRFVDSDEAAAGVLAATVRREVREEVGVEVGDVAYVTSNRFAADTGNPVVNVVFLARHEAGDPRVREPEELAAVDWFAPADIEDHEAVPPFTREYVAAAEARRRDLGW